MLLSCRTLYRSILFDLYQPELSLGFQPGPRLAGKDNIGGRGISQSEEGIAQLRHSLLQPEASSVIFLITVFHNICYFSLLFIFTVAKYNVRRTYVHS